MNRKEARIKRHKRRRRVIQGIPGKERLCVFKSSKHIYAQIVDDVDGKTVLSCSSLSREFKEKMSYGGNMKAAELVGKNLADKCKECGVKKVVFDSGGYLFHGRVKTLAEACRKGGLVF